MTLLAFFAGAQKRSRKLVLGLGLGVVLLLAMHDLGFAEEQGEASTRVSTKAAVKTTGKRVAQAGILSRTKITLPKAQTTEDADAPVIPPPVRPNFGAMIPSTIRASLPNPRVKRLTDEMSIAVGGESYLNRETPPAGIADYSMFSAHLRTHTEGNFLSGALEFGGTFSPGIDNYTNLEVPEGYVAIENMLDAEAGESQWSVAVGRKRETWSQLDSDWQLGLWQPLNRFDYLRPTEQGLTGGFLTYRYDNIEVLAFGSTVYIPNQGAPFQLNDNGKLVSNSPWFSEPTDAFVLRDKRTDVKYKLETPPVAEIVNHNSGGLMIRIGDMGQGAYVQASAIKKPRNEIATPFDAKMDLRNNTTYATVTVKPQLAYHNLVGFDAGYRARLVAASISVLNETVDPDQTPSGLNHETLEPMTLVSPKIEFRAIPSRFWGPRVSLSYLQAFGGDVKDEGPLASGGKGLFGPRLAYRQAMSLGTDALIYRSGRVRLEHGLKWIEEFSESGTILMTDLRLRLGDSWRMALMADILGSRQPLDETHSFIARYRGNDRVAGQVTYAF